MRTTNLSVSLGLCSYFLGGVGGHPRPDNLAAEWETLNNTTYGSLLFEMFFRIAPLILHLESILSGA